jgi:hypothetical protein
MPKPSTSIDASRASNSCVISSCFVIVVHRPPKSVSICAEGLLQKIKHALAHLGVPSRRMQRTTDRASIRGSCEQSNRVAHGEVHCGH